ncbi:MAG: hypothetical protein JSS96_16155 [Bacteroidetes bacterium]|nr:hypothetical protein [Bacteroidota bacterium]
MKKLFTLILVCGSFSLFAQHAAFMKTTHTKLPPRKKTFPNSMWYGRVGIGYAFTQGGQTMSAYGTPYNGSLHYVNNNNGSTATLTDFEVKKVSFNTGVHAVVAAGYMFDSHVGFELAGQFNIAPFSYTSNSYNYLSSGYNANINILSKAKSPIMLIPSFILQSGEQGFNLYTRVGLVLPVNTKVERTYRFDYLAGGPNGINNKEYTLEESSKFTVGYTGALGFSYKVDKIKLWAEVNVMSLSVELKEQKVTAFANDGRPVPLQYVTPGTVNYVQSGTYNANTEPTYSIPFSYIGAMIGISFKI